MTRGFRVDRLTTGYLVFLIFFICRKIADSAMFMLSSSDADSRSCNGKSFMSGLYSFTFSIACFKPTGGTGLRNNTVITMVSSVTSAHYTALAKP